MAINNQNVSPTAVGQAFQQAQTNQSNQANQPGAAPKSTWSFHTGGLFGKAPVGRGIGSETLSILQDAMLEVFKKATDPDVEMTLIPIDNTNEPGLAYSVLIVCLRYKSSPGLGVAYHTLIIEATGEKIPEKFEQINGQQVEIFRVAGDACDNVLMKKVSDKVSQAFKQSRVFNAEACVVPRGFDPKDKTNVHKLALNAGIACSTELEIRKPDFQDMNLAMSAHDSTLSVALTYSRQQFENAVGEPIRSDVLVSFSSQQQTNQQNTSINNGDRVARISELTGFIDIVWAPVAQQNGGFNPYVVQQAQSAYKYVARLVITDMYSPYAATPPAQLLSLVTALSVRDENSWIQTFRPVPLSGKEVDLHDIGAVGIEANFENNPTGFGTRVNTKLDTFRPENLGQLVGATIQPGLIISFDVPECGPSTWYSSIFAAAANGSAEATEAIYNAANQLTNNYFSRYFPVGTPMFVDTGNRIHTGYYIKNDVKRDIREIDYLAVMNLVGDTDPQAIRDWSDTFTRTQFPLAMRLAARKRMIKALTGQTAEFTGYAQRVTPTKELMDALSRSCKDAGLNINLSTPMNGSEFNNERGIYGYAGSAVLQAGQSTVFGRNMGNIPAGGAGFFQQSARWAR